MRSRSLAATVVAWLFNINQSQHRSNLGALDTITSQRNYSADGRGLVSPSIVIYRRRCNPRNGSQPKHKDFTTYWHLHWVTCILLLSAVINGIHFTFTTQYLLNGSFEESNADTSGKKTTETFNKSKPKVRDTCFVKVLSYSRRKKRSL